MSNQHKIRPEPKVLDTPNLKTPEECKKEGNRIPDIELVDIVGRKNSEDDMNRQKKEIGDIVKKYGCDYYDLLDKQKAFDKEQIRLKSEEIAKKTAEATEKYGETAAYWIGRGVELPKHQVGEKVDIKGFPYIVESCRPGPNGWNYEVVNPNNPQDVNRYDEWKINWKPGEPKFAKDSKVKFISPLSSIHTWKVKDVYLIGYDYNYDLIQDNIIPYITTVTQKEGVKEMELKAATQSGGRRRKTMKKSRKMRRKTNKKVRKMRRKSMKKSHNKK